MLPKRRSSFSQNYGKGDDRMQGKFAEVRLGFDGQHLLADIQGEIDHHSAAGLRSPIDSQLCRFRPRTLIINMQQVSFMDSSGLGLIVGRAELAAGMHGQVRVVNVSPTYMKLFALAGLERIDNLKIEGAS